MNCFTFLLISSTLSISFRTVVNVINFIFVCIDIPGRSAVPTQFRLRNVRYFCYAQPLQCSLDKVPCVPHVRAIEGEGERGTYVTLPSKSICNVNWICSPYFRRSTLLILLICLRRPGTEKNWCERICSSRTYCERTICSRCIRFYGKFGCCPYAIEAECSNILAGPTECVCALFALQNSKHSNASLLWMCAGFFCIDACLPFCDCFIFRWPHQRTKINEYVHLM